MVDSQPIHEQKYCYKYINEIYLTNIFTILSFSYLVNINTPFFIIITIRKRLLSQLFISLRVTLHKIF